MTTHAVPMRARPRTRRARHGLRAAAAGYSLAWLAGLAIPVTTVELDAPARAALDAVTADAPAVALRALLVHGAAAVALVVVALGLARAVTGRGERRLGRAVRAAGIGAAALSGLQLALELVLAGPVAGGSDADAAGALVDAINHLDGAKMLALAALATAGALAARRVAVPSRRLGLLGAVLALALVVSAAGYGLLVPALAPAAYVSLPLLLIWVTAIGLSLARAR